MKTSKENITVLALFAVLATTAVSAQTGLTLYDNADLNANGNSINNLSFLNPNGTNLKINASETNFTQENITGIQNINDFFNQTACDSDEAIKTIYPNGSYSCNQLSTTTEAENLSETLEAGNVANQSINLSGNNLQNLWNLTVSSGVSIGNSQTYAAGNKDIAIGLGSNAENIEGSSEKAIAIGNLANASDDQTIAIGDEARAQGSDAVAAGRDAVAEESGSIAIGSTTFSEGSSSIGIGLGARPSSFKSLALGYFAGYNSVEGNRSITIGNYDVDTGTAPIATGKDSISLGTAAQATAKGAVALGDEAQADEQYTVELGSPSQGYDLNVHGNLDLQNNNISNFFNQTACDSDEAIKTVYPNGSYDCNQLTQTTQSENLSETLEAGNVANQTLNLGSNPIEAVSKLNITNESSNTQIAAFEETGITLKQPLSVEADGPLSAANGIDLTDSTSNTIESYGTFYLSTSEGSPKDISLSPSGIVGVESNLSVTGNINMNGNNITEVNKISGDSDPVKISNDVEMTGPSPEIDLGNGMQVQRTGGDVVISD